MNFGSKGANLNEEHLILHVVNPFGILLKEKYISNQQVRAHQGTSTLSR
jgi:hypothetical protein